MKNKNLETNQNQPLYDPKKAPSQLIEIECQKCGNIDKPIKWNIRYYFGIAFWFTMLSPIAVLLYFVNTNPYICKNCNERDKLIKKLNNGKKIKIGGLSRIRFILVSSIFLILGFLLLIYFISSKNNVTSDNISIKGDVNNNLTNNTADWVVFTPEDQSFTITFPKKPEPLLNELNFDISEDIKVQRYISASQDGQVLYSIRKIELPTRYTDADPLLVLDIPFNLWFESGDVLLEKKQSKINGYDTMDFKLSMNKDGKIYYTTVRSIWDGKGNVYDMMIGTDQLNVPDYQKFINSFIIL